MSTDRQEESPKRQREEVERLAVKEGCCILEWYEDHGLTGTESKNRKDFLRLLEDAKSGRFSVVLTYEQSRLSRENVMEAMAHWQLLKQAGVQLITCQRGRIDLDNLGNLITAIVEQHGAHDESIKIALRSVSGRVRKLRQGQWLNGSVFGYDRLYFDEHGVEARRVHFREQFGRPRGWTVKLVPSADVAAVEAVQFMFRSVAAGVSTSKISAALNRSGILTRDGVPFTPRAVSGTTRNPIYMGTLLAGKHATGKFKRFNDDGEIRVDGAHEALVTPAEFARAQAARPQRRRPSRLTDNFLLTGLTFCAHCGHRINGGYWDWTESAAARYACTGHQDRFNGAPGVNHPAAKPGQTSFAFQALALPIERAIVAALRERFLAPHSSDELLGCVRRQNDAVHEETAGLRGQLERLQTRIAKAADNLALAATPDEFKSVSATMARWKTEAAALEDRVRQSHAVVPTPPEAARIIARISEVLQKIDSDNAWLSVPIVRNALAAVVSRIVLGRTESGGVFARIEFLPGFVADDVVELTPEQIYPARLEDRIAAYVEQYGPVRTRIVAAAMGAEEETCRNTLHRLAGRGLVGRKLSPRGALVWGPVALGNDPTRDIRIRRLADVVAFVRSEGSATALEVAEHLAVTIHSARYLLSVARRRRQLESHRGRGNVVFWRIAGKPAPKRGELAVEIVPFVIGRGDPVSVEEAAEALAASPGAVRQALRRAAAAGQLASFWEHPKMLWCAPGAPEADAARERIIDAVCSVVTSSETPLLTSQVVAASKRSAHAVRQALVKLYRDGRIGRIPQPGGMFRWTIPGPSGEARFYVEKTLPRLVAYVGKLREPVSTEEIAAKLDMPALATLKLLKEAFGRGSILRQRGERGRYVWCGLNGQRCSA